MTVSRPIVPLDALTSSVAHAVAAWNGYLSSDGAWTSAAAAAHIIFTEELGAHWSPTRPAAEDELRALATLGRIVDLWRAHPWFFTRRRLSASLSNSGPAVRYLKQALGVHVHADIDGRPRLMRAHAPLDHARLTAHLDRTPATAPQAGGGVPADACRRRPDGFPVKGNADSWTYHPPGSRWYDKTVAEFWFADERAAEMAGFTRAGG